jgi:ribonucleoside-diphosphate reductase alpha chain
VKSNLGGDFVVLNRELVLDLKAEGLWNSEMLDQLKYFNGELKDIPNIPKPLKEKHLTVFSIDFNYIVDAAARRQKWIDQSQSVTLFLADPDMKTLSHMYRAAWRKGLKTTYYLRILSASDIEKITLSESKKKVRGTVAKVAASEATCSLETHRISFGCEACQ